MAHNFRNLIFEGGGVKGVAYIGAIEILNNEGILEKILRAGGTSAGAITALLISLNYNPEEIKKIFLDLEFKEFLDNSWLVPNTKRLLKQYGWYKGEYICNWLNNLIKKKTKLENATFQDLYNLKEKYNFKDLYVVGTNLSTGFSEIFSQEHTPNMSIVDSIYISLAIPLFFTAPHYKGNVYVDGGLLDNYPIRIFDRKKYTEKFFQETDYYRLYNKRLRKDKTKDYYTYNWETLGLRVDSSQEIAIYEGFNIEKRKINNFFSFSYSLIQTLMDSQANFHFHSDDRHRTIYIDNLRVKSLDFNLNSIQKYMLIESGKKCTKKFLANYDYKILTRKI